MCIYVSLHFKTDRKRAQPSNSYGSKKSLNKITNGFSCAWLKWPVFILQRYHTPTHTPFKIFISFIHTNLLSIN